MVFSHFTLSLIFTIMTPAFWCLMFARELHIYMVTLMPSHFSAPCTITCHHILLESYTSLRFAICFFNVHNVTDTAGDWVVAEKTKASCITLILSDCTLWLMTTSHCTPPAVLRCVLMLDIALVTCGPSCPTASWWAHAKGKTVFGFPSVSPWTSETVQWKLSMLQLIRCRC